MNTFIHQGRIKSIKSHSKH